MNADRLLALYDRVADAPDAVPRLRRFVLDLAVRGKLVEQDPADEPASELLKRIEVERARVPNATKGKSCPLKAEAVDGDLFDLPTGWEWVPLARISDVTMGQSPPGETYNKSGDGVPLINGPVEFTPGPFGRTVVNQFTTAPKKFCEEGDLLICVRGSTTGRTNVAAFRACIGRGVAAIRSPFDDDYVRLFLWKARDDIISMGRGIAFPSVSKKQLETLAIPFPPLAEQHRIVATVDELMALCDRLEKTRTVREDSRDRLAKASYSRLSVSDTDAVTFRSHARFAVDALPTLTARADQVKRLRQTILDLAVRGKLVEQDPADEPASELLKRIEVERARVPNATKGKSCPLKAEAVDGDLFDLPTGWEWVPLARISDVTMGQSPPGETYNKSGDGVPLINGPVEFTPGPFGRTVVNQFTTAPKKFCEEGDLLICVRGSTTGRTNVAAFRACIGRGVAAIHSPFDDDYVRLFLWKARDDIISMGRGIAFPSVSKKQLETLAIPFPPLAEQHRIVATVYELMALCDRLEASLGAVDTGRHRLLESLLQEALDSAVNEIEAAK